MRISKRITPLFLSFTLIACCLTFQADGFLPTGNTFNSSWIIGDIEKSSNENSYHLNHRKAHSILENNFTFFDFKCCLTHHKSLFASQYKQQNNLNIPTKTNYLKIILQSSLSKDDTLIG
ncbi:hypothetical protein MWU58_05910 [Flavobacteriaceae bacterium S0825]|uniref:hypothetical protein n=1 Tax=Gaetbulibacter sp. S0825 TaxID=2720084 RepID=UPI00142FCF0F|nr:hypothetical protein [Gaetbulibacter sp. S0825]MCK0108819.1 hypothetical protein [Flavobacteriaceae bacterium S0825]NIX64455.1 hypothetical protein [Gaetbulibacter sp. S0825]